MRIARVACCVLIAGAALGAAQPRYVISGRVEDPHHLRPANIMLMVGYERDGSGVAYPVTIAPNGTFATNTLIPAKYVLTLFRDPHDPDRKSTPVGLTIANIEDRDLTGVNVTIRPDVTVVGRFRMEPETPWPSRIVVTACLGDEGLRHAACQVAEGATEGRFLLRNAFGRRLLRLNWTPLTGQRYNEPRILLDGRDVTGIPTDFSANPSSDLQVVFSRARDGVPSAPQWKPDLSPMFLPGVQVEGPAKLSAGLAVFIPTRDTPGRRRSGYIVEARAGASGARVSAGLAGYLEYLGLDARAVLVRTFRAPWSAAPRSTYAGAEGGLTIAYVRVAAGVGRRLSGPGADDRTIFIWSAGVHLPLFK